MTFSEVKKRILEKEYSHLNPQQREAVFTVDGPLLILAGAGSGKTTVLVNKIEFAIKYGNAYFAPEKEGTAADLLLLEQYFAEPDESFAERVTEILSCSPAESDSVMAITFTNKAANELKERLSKKLGSKADDVWAGTFHSVCVRILRRFIQRIDYNNDFTIYDADDQKKVFKEVIKELGISEKEMPVSSVMKIISNAKDNMVFPAEFADSAKNDYRLNLVAKVYSQYQSRLKNSNALDFDDIIMLTVYLLETDEYVRDYCSRQFKYIYVDEYQDTNRAQYRLVSMIAAHHGNLTVVGDDDQSIYKFRGATIENILSFENCFSNTKVIKLEQNYRSTSHILDTANAIIKNNSLRKGKNLWTDRGTGDKIKVYVSTNEYSEGIYIADEIHRLVGREGKKYSDFAVLYRVNTQAAAIEEALLKSSVPYKIFAGMKFYEHKEVKDILAYLWVVANHADDLRLKRIINEPKRSIGPSTLAAAEEIARVENRSLYEVISEAEKYPQLNKAAPKLCAFTTLINALTGVCATQAVGDFVRHLLTESTYLSYVEELDEKDGRDRKEIVNTFVSNVDNYTEQNPDASLLDFLLEVSLASELDDSENSAEYVSLMTVHSAKGLEFPIVFCTGMEEGVFPSVRSFDEPGGLEEERRLVYVAITRAKEQLYITRAKSRRTYSGPSMHLPSRFLEEIPSEYIEELNPVQEPENTYNSYRRFAGEKFNYSHNTIRIGAADRTPSIEQKQVDITAGDRVQHMSFGDGTVLSVMPTANDALIEVDFDKVGVKKLMFQYAKLKKL